MVTALATKNGRATKTWAIMTAVVVKVILIPESYRAAPMMPLWPQKKSSPRLETTGEKIMGV